MVYFLVRRFLAKDRVLTVRDVLFDARARNGGIARDSLIVGIFIIVHIGSRYFGAATAVALTEPGIRGSRLLQVWLRFFRPEHRNTLTTMWHVFWWLALGSIFFLPYFLPPPNTPTSSLGCSNFQRLGQIGCVRRNESAQF